MLKVLTFKKDKSHCPLSGTSDNQKYIERRLRFDASLKLGNMGMVWHGMVVLNSYRRHWMISSQFNFKASGNQNEVAMMLIFEPRVIRPRSGTHDFKLDGTEVLRLKTSNRNILRNFGLKIKVWTIYIFEGKGIPESI